MNPNICRLERSDLLTLISWAEDEKTLIQWCGPVFDFPLTLQQLDVYFSETEKDLPARYVYKYETGDGKMAGVCELGNIDRRNEAGSVCRVFVDKEFRGKGIAKELVSEVLKFGFGTLLLNRIDLNVYTFNAGAIKCYEELGFVKEGVKRRSTKFGNEYWDCCIYSMLKEDWK